MLAGKQHDDVEMSHTAVALVCFMHIPSMPPDSSCSTIHMANGYCHRFASLHYTAWVLNTSAPCCSFASCQVSSHVTGLSVCCHSVYLGDTALLLKV